MKKDDIILLAILAIITTVFAFVFKAKEEKFFDFKEQSKINKIIKQTYDL